VIDTRLRNLKEWVEAWYHTLRIKFFEPELYKLLSTWSDSDLFEVEEPK
jgi:hypothetical protein